MPFGVAGLSAPGCFSFISAVKRAKDKKYRKLNLILSRDGAEQSCTISSPTAEQKKEVNLSSLPPHLMVLRSPEGGGGCPTFIFAL